MAAAAAADVTSSSEIARTWDVAAMVVVADVAVLVAELHVTRTQLGSSGSLGWGTGGGTNTWVVASETVVDHRADCLGHDSGMMLPRRENWIEGCDRLAGRGAASGRPPSNPALL